jgi:IS30 family transposase
LDFRKINDRGIEHAMERLNNRPRKNLGFATPNEMFFNDISNKETFAIVI